MTKPLAALSLHALLAGTLALAACSKSASDTTVDAKPVDAEPVDTKPVDTKTVDTKTVDTKTVDTKTVDTKTVDTKTVDTKPGTGASDSDSGDETGASEPATVATPGAFPFDRVYWSWAEDKHATIDITDASPPEHATGTLGDLMASCKPTAAAGSHVDCNGIDGVLDPAHPLMPPGHAIGDAWIIVDADGTSVGKASAFGIYGGASETHFHVILTGFLDKARGGLTYPGATAASPKAKLEEAKSQSKLPADVFAAVKAELAAKLDAEGLAVLAKHPLEKTDVSIYAPRMPGDAKLLVRVSIEFPESPEDDGEADEYAMSNYIAALFTVGGGRILETLYGPASGIDFVTVTHFVDLDGDGYDEILWNSAYYEGEYTHLTRWDGTNTRTRGIGGDGA